MWPGLVPSEHVSKMGRMNRESAVRLVEKLCAGYPHVSLTEAQAETYRQYLRDLDADATEALIEELIASSVEFPRIAELRRPLIEAESGFPAPLEAYRSISEPGHEIHDLAREVRDLMGGAWAFKVTDEPGILRTQFLRLYSERRDEALRAANAQHFRSAA